MCYFLLHYHITEWHEDYIDATEATHHNPPPFFFSLHTFLTVFTHSKRPEETPRATLLSPALETVINHSFFPSSPRLWFRRHAHDHSSLRDNLTVHNSLRLLRVDLPKPAGDPHASCLVSGAHKVAYPVNSPGIRGSSIVSSRRAGLVAAPH